MNKHLSTTAITILILIYLIPLVAATSQTVNLSKNEVKTFNVDLKVGERINGHIKCSGGENFTGFLTDQNSIIFKIIDPDQSYVDIFHSGGFNVGISDTSYTFTAEVTGTYIFEIANTVYPDCNKTVTLTYDVTPKYGVSLPTRLEGLFDQLSIYGPIILIILSCIVALISLILRARVHAERVKNGITPNPAFENTENTQTTDIHNDKLVSEAARKYGVLLECKNAWLSDKELYYYRNIWQVSDMVEASVTKYGSLAIRFNDGKVRKFKLAPNEAEMASRDFYNHTAGSFIQLNRFMKERSYEWAKTINTLISKRH